MRATIMPDLYRPSICYAGRQDGGLRAEAADTEIGGWANVGGPAAVEFSGMPTGREIRVNLKDR